MATKPAKKAVPVKKIGRPSKFTQALAGKICERVASGESLRKVCATPGYPHMSNVLRWLADDKKAAFRDQYARAREAQADAMAEDLLELHEKAWVPVLIGGKPVMVKGEPLMTVDKASVAAVRLEAENKKWLMGKLKPKKYGDKVTQEHTGADGGPIKAETVTRIELVPLE
jgi:hypothetical protein